MNTKSFFLCLSLALLCACSPSNSGTDSYSTADVPMIKIDKKGNAIVQRNAVEFVTAQNSDYRIVDTKVKISHNSKRYLIAHGISKATNSGTITIAYPLKESGTLDLDEPSYSCEGYNCSFCEMLYDEAGTPISCCCLEGIPAIFATCKFSIGTLKPGTGRE